MFAPVSRPASTPSSMMFIDASVTDVSVLLADVPRQVLPFVLSPAQGIATITQQLRNYVQVTGQRFESLHFVAHGAPGLLRLGQDALSSGSLPCFAALLRQWRDYLVPEAELLLYGCRTGATAAGRGLLAQLSLLTGAKVAASSTVVGSAAWGGNWELDVQTAPMNGVVAFSATVQEQYAGTFAEFVVTNINDFGPGSGSLYQAITNANNNPGLDTITFNIPEEQLNIGLPIQGNLPTITDPVFIDGYSQPGATQNTLEVGNNANILIRLEGSGSVLPVLNISSGGDGTTIQGLSINYAETAIGIGDSRFTSEPKPNNVTIRGNHIGVDPLGFSGRIETYSIFAQGSGHVIGGETPADRNIIASSRNLEAIRLEAVSDTIIQGNYIGVDPTGTSILDVGHQKGTGISLVSSSNNIITSNLVTGNGIGVHIGGESPSNSVLDNLIGTDATGIQAPSNSFGYENRYAGIAIFSSNQEIKGNTIAFNGYAGVSILAEGFAPDSVSSAGITVSENSIFENGIDIDLFPITRTGEEESQIFRNEDFRTENDPGDLDEGGNGLLNYPVLTTVTQDGSQLTVIGALNSKPDETYVLEFFANPENSPNGGKTFIGATFVNTDSAGNGDFNKTFDLTEPLSNAFITATTTDAQGSTSEFSDAQGIGINRPIVSLTTTDELAIQEGESVTYRIERDSAEGKMVVRFTTSLTGLPNTEEEYTLTAPALTQLDASEYAITLADGQANTTVTLTPRIDTFDEGTERFELSLVESDTYVRSADDRSSIVRISDRITIEPDPAAAPINQLPDTPQSTIQGETLIFSEATDNRIAIFDADTEDNLELTLAIDGGTITLAGTEGLTFTAGDGDSDEELTLTGTQTAINQALNGLSFQPDEDFFGQAQLQILTNDQDSLNPQQDEDTLRFVVFPESGSEAQLVNRNEENWFEVNSPGGQTFKLTLESQNTSNLNELGMFQVDDAEGTIEGIAPGESGYAAAAIARSRVVMSALSNFSDNLFPGLETTRHLTMDGNSFWGFYLVSNSTTDTVKGLINQGQTPSNLAFGFPDAGRLQIDEAEDGSFTLNFDDGLGSVDFDDFKVKLTPTFDLLPAIGTGLQDQNEGELIDLRNYTGFKAATFGNFSDAAYGNELGFYTIDNAAGAVDNLMPGDAGYAAAALARRVDFSGGFQGGSLFAPFMVANGTISDFLAQNPTNQFNAEVHTYFAFLGANPDGIDHVRLLGDNTFAFEDLLGGGDLDYNDAIIQVNFV